MSPKDSGGAFRNPYARKSGLSAAGQARMSCTLRPWPRPGGKIMPDLTDVSTHYEFGENWSKYAELIDASRIALAEADFTRILHRDEVAGRSFLDIGCGSGLHSVAASRCGAGSVSAIDIDPVSVSTAQAVLARHAQPGVTWSAQQQSVFDIDPSRTYDIVYSWGVLHHTGNMNGAIASAARLVGENGMLVLALYRKTPLCGFWRWEKRLYSEGSEGLRRVLETTYNGARALSFWLRGRSFAAYKRDYAQLRGMEYMTDVRDWLGGYPYESISKAEMLAMASTLGFEFVRGEVRENPGTGLLGSGCDEYVFRKRAGN
jgi:SAM-dependent methyltransferase